MQVTPVRFQGFLSNLFKSPYERLLPEEKSLVERAIIEKNYDVLPKKVKDNLIFNYYVPSKKHFDNIPDDQLRDILMEIINEQEFKFIGKDGTVVERQISLGGG